MKIQGIKSQTDKSDILELNGNIFKINVKDYDLDNLLSPSQPTEENPEPDNSQFFTDNQCYIDAQGIKQLKIYVNDQDFFDYMNNNFKLFFDIDLNGDIDKAEFEKWVIHYNLSEPEKEMNRGKIKESFSPEHWKTRMEICNPKR